MLMVPSSRPPLLGVILDSTLYFPAHINSITQSAYFHLCNIICLRPPQSAAILVHSLVTFLLDYYNSVLFVLPSETLHKLQLVQISVLLQNNPIQPSHNTCSAATPLTPNHIYHIQYKKLLFTHKAIHKVSPSLSSYQLTLSGSSSSFHPSVPFVGLSEPPCPPTLDCPSISPTKFRINFLQIRFYICLILALSHNKKVLVQTLTLSFQCGVACASSLQASKFPPTVQNRNSQVD